MPLIIDGYNLLHAAGIIPSGLGPGTLQRSRQALLNFLVESLEPKELSRAVVVFDARQAPKGLARSIVHRGLKVRFASPEGDADLAIEELIRRDSAPRRLTVVSSDHRLQNAARRRGATGIDSDVWFAQLVRRRANRGVQHASEPQAPPQLTADEVAFWVREFFPDKADTETDAPPRKEAKARDSKPVDDDEPAAPRDDIFPPGYADDLFDDES